MTMLAPVLVTPPDAAPVSLVEAKAHLRVDHDDDDAVIAAMVEAATALLDGWRGVLGRAMVTQTWRQDLRAWPWGRKLYLTVDPALEIVAIRYWPADGGAQAALAEDRYSGILADHLGPFVRLGADLPALACRDDAVSVEFVAGFGAPEDVPASLKAAIMLMVGHLYEHREASAENAMSGTVQALISPLRRVPI